MILVYHNRSMGIVGIVCTGFVSVCIHGVIVVYRFVDCDFLRIIIADFLLLFWPVRFKF